MQKKPGIIQHKQLVQVQISLPYMQYFDTQDVSETPRENKWVDGGGFISEKNIFILCSIQKQYKSYIVFWGGSGLRLIKKTFDLIQERSKPEKVT